MSETNDSTQAARRWVAFDLPTDPELAKLATETTAALGDRKSAAEWMPPGERPRNPAIVALDKLSTACARRLAEDPSPTLRVVVAAGEGEAGS